MPDTPHRGTTPDHGPLHEVLAVADRLGIDVACAAAPVFDSSMLIHHSVGQLWPGASLYKPLAAVALSRQIGANLSTPVQITPDDHVPGGAGLSLTQDPVTLTWRELMRWMLIGSDNTSAQIILRKVGIAALAEVASDAGMSATSIVPTSESMTTAVRSARRVSEGPKNRAIERDDELLELARTDAILGSVTTATDQIKFMQALWSGTLLDSDGTRTVTAMLGQQLIPHRISRVISYPGVTVASKTGSWGPFRHETAVVTHGAEAPVAVCVMTRSLEFDRFVPAIDDAIGEIAAILVNSVRARF